MIGLKELQLNDRKIYEALHLVLQWLDVILIRDCSEKVPAVTSFGPLCYHPHQELTISSQTFSDIIAMMFILQEGLGMSGPVWLL